VAGNRIAPTMSGHEKAGAIPGGWNEGVGEHVRTRSQPLGREALGETAERERPAPNEERPFLLPDRPSKVENSVQPLT